jgi:hypothetical protein
VVKTSRECWRAGDILTSRLRVVARFENPLEKLKIKSKARLSGPNAHQAVRRRSLKTIDLMGLLEINKATDEGRRPAQDAGVV